MKNKNFKFGYMPSFYTKFIRFIVLIVQNILFLNKNNRFSNEFVQSLNLNRKIKYNKKELLFKTGHGRLDWRAKTFYTEEPLMIKWLENFTKDDIFLDIGANVGIYSVAALSRGCKVISRT